MPDIDVDFSDRDKVVKYLIDKYGEDRVCQVINFSYITPVVAIKDVGRVLGIPYYITDKISKRNLLMKHGKNALKIILIYMKHMQIIKNCLILQVS